MWNFNLGREYTKFLPELKEKLEPPVGNIIKQVWILGGEPLLQYPPELERLLRFIKENSDKEIVLFTRFDEDYFPDVLYELCDYIKCGKYDESQSIDDYEMYGITLATANQYVIKVSEKHETGN